MLIISVQLSYISWSLLMTNRPLTLFACITEMHNSGTEMLPTDKS